MHITSKRPAIAMIELIFAIVIMGIVMMSAPMLINTATKSSIVGLQQEGINEASSRLAMILTYPWDKNNMNGSCIVPVLNTSSATTALAEVNETVRRIGVPNSTNSHTFQCGSSDDYNATAIASSGTGNIGSFNDNNVSLTLDSSGSGGSDYLEQSTVNIASKVRYINDAANYNSSSPSYTPGSTATGTSSIKEITLTLTSSSTADELNQKNIVLHAFSCNIGGFEFAHREF